MKNCILAVDIGTTSLKAGIISTLGNVISYSMSRSKIRETKDTATGWIDQLQEAIERLYFLGCKITAVCISGNGPTVVSQSGITLRWDEKIPQHSFTGDAKTSLFVPRISRFKELFPQEYENSKYIFSGPEFLIYQLTGNAVTILPEERFLAAYWTESALKEAGIPSEKMPPYVEIGHNCGKLKESAAYYLRLPPDIPVYAGGPDFVVALIGTKTLEPGRMCDRCGSSEGINFCTDRPVFGEGLRTLPSVQKGLWNLSYLIPNSSRIPLEKRMHCIKQGIDKIFATLKENNIKLPDSMTVSGGQAKEPNLLKLKKEVTELEINLCNCEDAELIGDLCAVLKGNGTYDSIKTAAEHIVREKKV